MSVLYSTILIIITIASFGIFCLASENNSSTNRYIRRQRSLEDEKGKNVMENEDEELTKRMQKGKNVMENENVKLMKNVEKGKNDMETEDEELARSTQKGKEVQASNEQSNPRKRSSQDRSTSSESHGNSKSKNKGIKKADDKKAKSVRIKTVVDWVNDPQNIARVKDEPIETEMVVPQKIKKRYERLPSEQLFYRFLEGAGSAASNDELEKSVSGSNTIHDHTGLQSDDTASSRIAQAASANSGIKQTNSNISGISETNQNMSGFESNKKDIIQNESLKIKRKPNFIRSTSSSGMNETLPQLDRATSNIRINQNITWLLNRDSNKNSRNESPNFNPLTSNEKNVYNLPRIASRGSISKIDSYEMNQSEMPSNSKINRNQQTLGSDQSNIKPDTHTVMSARVPSNIQIDPLYNRSNPHTLVLADGPSNMQIDPSYSKPNPHTLVLADPASKKAMDPSCSKPNPPHTLVLADNASNRQAALTNSKPDPHPSVLADTPSKKPVDQSCSKPNSLHTLVLADTESKKPMDQSYSAPNLQDALADAASKRQGALTKSSPNPHTLVLADAPSNKQTDQKSNKPNKQKSVLENSTSNRKNKQDARNLNSNVSNRLIEQTLAFADLLSNQRSSQDNPMLGRNPSSSRFFAPILTRNPANPHATNEDPEISKAIEFLNNTARKNLQARNFPCDGSTPSNIMDNSKAPILAGNPHAMNEDPEISKAIEFSNNSARKNLQARNFPFDGSTPSNIMDNSKVPILTGNPANPHAINEDAAISKGNEIPKKTARNKFHARYFPRVASTPSNIMDKSKAPILTSNPANPPAMNEEAAIISQGVDILNNAAREHLHTRNTPRDASTSRINQINANVSDLSPLTESEWGKECAYVTNSLMSNEPLQRRVRFNEHLIRNALEARREVTPSFRPTSILKDLIAWKDFYAKYNVFKQNLALLYAMKTGRERKK